MSGVKLIYTNVIIVSYLKRTKTYSGRKKCAKTI